MNPALNQIYQFPCSFFKTTKPLSKMLSNPTISSLNKFPATKHLIKKSNRYQIHAQNFQSSNKGVIIGSNTDIIIVGAGVAGAALAHTLGKDGRSVHVIEKDLCEPNRIVGELLQPGGYLKLIELGLEDCIEEIDAQRVFGYIFYMDEETTRMECPIENFHLDITGVGLHNGRFIQRMREKAIALPNVTIEQGRVTSLLEENGTIKGVQYKTKDGQEKNTNASLTIVCDGCLSNLRKSLSNSKVEVQSNFVGLILENYELPFANNLHVILTDPSPILLFPISSTEVRCLVDVPGQKLPSIQNGEMANYLKSRVVEQVPYEFRHAIISAIDKGNIRAMPNRSMPADPRHIPGAFLIGDALNMRHPVSASGMTVALSDIVILRDLLRQVHDLNDAASLNKHLRSFYTLRKPLASTLNILASTMYNVFRSSTDGTRKEWCKSAFEYLSLGGIFSSEAMAALSGLSPFPWRLFLQLSVMGMYAFGRLLVPFPSLEQMQKAEMISTAYNVILPIIKDEGLMDMPFSGWEQTEQHQSSIGNQKREILADGN